MDGGNAGPVPDNGPANPDLGALFVDFMAYRSRTAHPPMTTFVERAQYLLDHADALESVGADIPGLFLLDQMLRPNSPVRADELVKQANDVDDAIDAAYAQFGLSGLPPRNPRRR